MVHLLVRDDGGDGDHGDDGGSHQSRSEWIQQRVHGDGKFQVRPSSVSAIECADCAAPRQDRIADWDRKQGMVHVRQIQGRGDLVVQSSYALHRLSSSSSASASASASGYAANSSLNSNQNNHNSKDVVAATSTQRVALCWVSEDYLAVVSQQGSAVHLRMLNTMFQFVQMDMVLKTGLAKPVELLSIQVRGLISPFR